MNQIEDVVAELSSDRVTELALELIAVDTQNPPGRTVELVEWIESFLDDLGIEANRVTADPAKPNLLATISGRDDRTLLYNGHLDTVPFDRTAWTYDPLGEREGDRIYGRGATDMKGPLAAMLHAAEAYVRAGIEPPVDLTFAIVSDEETGGAAGLSTLLERNLIEADACVIGEPTCEEGRHSVTVADRGSIWLTIEAIGEAAHGSRPPLGVNAIDRLYETIMTLRERFGRRTLEIDATMEPILEESIEYYTPTMGAAAARDLFVHPSINLGTIEGGEAINSVPRSARAEVDIRLAAGVRTPEMLAEIRGCVDSCAGVTIVDVSWSIGTAEPIDSPLVEATASAAESVIGDRIYRRSATGGGDAKKLRHAGVPTVEFALGTDTAHAVDEYITVEALSGNAEIYSRLPGRWLARQ